MPNNTNVDLNLDSNEQIASLLPTKAKGYGVFQVNEDDDINFLVENFTAPALARALRFREQVISSGIKV